MQICNTKMQTKYFLLSFNVSFYYYRSLLSITNVKGETKPKQYKGSDKLVSYIFILKMMFFVCLLGSSSNMRKEHILCVFIKF